MGKGVNLSEAAVTALRKANRKLISANKDLNAAVQALVKASKAKTPLRKRRRRVKPIRRWLNETRCCGRR